MGIQVYSNEGPNPFQRGDNHKSARVVSFKYFLLMNHSTIKAQIYTSASWYSAELILFNSPGVMRDHNRVKHIYICFNGENLWKSLQDTTEPKKVQIYLQCDLMAIKKSNFECFYIRNISQYDWGEWCSPWSSYFKYPFKQIEYFFQKSCIDQGKQLEALESWPALIDYILKAWEIVEELPLWDNPDHNKGRARCFKTLSVQCKRAINSSRLSQSEYEDILSRWVRKLDVINTVFLCFIICNSNLWYSIHNDHISYLVYGWWDFCKHCIILKSLLNENYLL
jgi:hypothetical protein